MAQRDSVSQQTAKASREVKSWVVPLAKIGYFAKGIVYIAWGIFALQAVYGYGNKKVDMNTTLAKIVTQPFGRYLLFIILIGLVAYVLWRLILLVLNPEHQGLVTRFGYLSSGLGYAGLALAAYGLVTGTGSGGSSSTGPHDFTVRVLHLPAGRWIVAAVGLFIIISGFYQMYYGYKAKFKANMRLSEMKVEQRKAAVGAGQFGSIARGIIYLIVGIFLVQAALQYNPSKAGGLGDALVALAKAPYGIYVFAIVALGLLAYGIFSEVMARYYRLAA
ncbi:MAG: DUF1206 domain-containing protein [Omnitrophica WOR_2 bacterium]